MNLIKLIKSNKVEVKTLAKELGVSVGAIYKWSNGTSFPSARNLIEMCKYLGYDEKTVYNSIREARKWNMYTNISSWN